MASVTDIKEQILKQLKKRGKKQIRWLLDWDYMTSPMERDPKVMSLGLELVTDGKEMWWEQDTGLKEERRYLDPLKPEYSKLYDFEFMSYKLNEIIKNRQVGMFTLPVKRRHKNKHDLIKISFDYAEETGEQSGS